MKKIATCSAKWRARCVARVRGAKPLAALEACVARAVAARDGEVLLAAVSGGPDSVALAALLARICDGGRCTLVLGHVNHGLRDSAWQDEAVTLSLGASLGARVLTGSLPPGSSDEARLRDERYATLLGMAAVCGARRVFTAHHAADQTETVLLSLFRGAGPSGLCGMPAARELGPGVELVRPLLGVEPEALRAYCAALHLPFVLDPTNLEIEYRRNALRSALPALRAAFPKLDAAVARCAAILAEERAGSQVAAVRERLRAELVAATGDARDVTFERLDAAARAIERGSRGRHFLRRGVEMVSGSKKGPA
jgi:tRNA(Ile)-lysidine synthase